MQTAEGAPDAANVPTAATEYTNWQGSIGLYERTQAPADFSRMFLSDWDGTRPGQVTCWVRWPGDTVALSGGNGAPNVVGASDPINRAFALLDDSSGPGFGCNGSFYVWDGTQFTALFPLTWTDSPGYGGKSGSPPLFTSQYMCPPSQMVYTTAAGTWMCNASNVWRNIVDNTTSSAVPGGLSVLFYDFWATLVLNSGGTGTDISVTAYRPTGPNGTAIQTAQLPTSGVPTAVYSASNVNAVVPGKLVSERGIAGVIASEGVLWVSTERCIYGVQWNDLLNTWKVERLVTVPRITGAPVEWRSEVYVPAEGTLIHIIPGQKGFDIVRPDQFDVLPLPFNGWITQGIATPDALYCKVVEAQDGATATTRAAIMRLDTTGAWSVVDSDVTGTTRMGEFPLVKTIDQSHPPGIGYFTDRTHVRLLPAKTAGRNPTTMLVSQRPQAATGTGVTPWETGVARSNQKQLLRYRLEIEDCVGFSVDVYYQLPADAYPGATNTFTTGAGANTGTWHKCGSWTASMSGYSGSIDANGNGWVWVEFDNSTSYGGGVGILPLYPDYTAVRWLLRINGDTSGTHVPRIRGFRTDREEYISKAKVITARIDLTAETRRQGANDTLATATDTVRDSAWVQSEMAYIEGMMAGKHAQTLVTPKGTTYQVTITKWQEILQAFGADGVESAYVQLTMKVEPLIGVL